MYKKFTFYFLLLIILLGPVGQFVLFKFTPIYELNLLTELYNEASWVKGKPKIAIMGSSHARYHIIPSEIAKLNKNYNLSDIVNIGENAASPFAMYTSFMKNRDKFSELETVYYTLEPHMLGEKYYTYNKFEEILLSYDQWKYLEEKHNKKNNYFYPLQTFVNSLKYKNTNRSKTNGYSKLKHKKFKKFAKGRVIKLIYEPIELFPVSSFGMNYFKELKDELSKQGTELIFVLTPTYTWQKYYAQEAKVYDDMLVEMLNKNLGNVKVVGSFWPEDFALEYKDFKDDTHMAHSGAVQFTREVFSNINEHKDLKKDKLLNTYLYRHTMKNKRASEKEIFTKNANEFNWKYDKYTKFKKYNDFVQLNYSNIKKFSVVDAKFTTVEGVSSVELLIELPKEDVKMFSISLKYGKEYAHFFIKTENIKNNLIRLRERDVNKSSNNFKLDKINGITVRMYPKNTSVLSGFKMKTIRFNTVK